MKALTSMVVVVLALTGSLALADEHAHPMAPAVTNPAWAKVMTLAGNWEGTANEQGKQMPAKTTFRMVSAGSVLMNILGEGTPHEMVTMFHMDLKDLLATHYCSAQNQPRMKAGPLTAANQVSFEFKDGTNIGPNDGHMQRLVVTFVDADHHNEDWTFLDKGKESTGHFEFHRVH
jgi:hypothetical protein